MEIPGLNQLNNSSAINPGKVTPSDASPVKVPARQTEQNQQKTASPISLPNQAPVSPVLNKNTQSLSNILIQLGIPNTTENNQLAQVLANYRQPINNQTMTQVARALGPILYQNALNVEAGVVLMINRINISPESIKAISSLLSGGGFSQSLLSLNKDLQKLVDLSHNTGFQKNLKTDEQLKSITNITPQNSSETKTFSNTNNLIVGNNFANLTPNLKQTKNEPAIDGIKEIIKNPYPEETEEDLPEKENRNKKQKVYLEKISETNSDFVSDHQELISQIQKKAQKIQSLTIGILTSDILSNPQLFQLKLSQLKRNFAELESNLKEFRDLLKKCFPELFIDNDFKENDDSFVADLLKLFSPDSDLQKSKKMSKLKLANLESGLEKNIIKTIENVNFSFAGREILTKSFEGMCVPLTIPFKGELYNAEILIQRDDHSNKKAEIGMIPITIQLSIETKSMGKIAVDIRNLKKDLQISLAVEKDDFQQKIKANIHNLQENLQNLAFDLKPISCSVNPQKSQSNSILLPNKYTVSSLKRIEGLA